MTEWIITSSLLIILIIVLRRTLKGKINLRLQYALWALVLVRLLIPINLFSSSFSILNLTDSISIMPTTQVEAPTVQLPTEETIPNRPITVPATTPSPVIPGATVHMIPEPKTTWEYPYTLTQTLTFLWLLGVAVSAAVVTVSNLRFASKLKRCREAAHVACKIPVFYCASVESPFLFGLWKPSIYLPISCKDDPKVLSHVLAHEMAHYHHRDHIWAVARCICLCLHWYNPLVWTAAVLSRQDAELACDEAAIAFLGQEQRTDYGKTLIDLSCAKPGAQQILTTATTMDGSKKSLTERIQMIAKHPKTTFITLFLVILASAVILALTFTGARQALSHTGRLVYYNGSLYAVEQAPSKLFIAGYPWVQEDSNTENEAFASMTHPPLVGTIQKYNKNRIPNQQFSSNYFPEGTKVYAWDEDSQLLFVQVPWSEDNSFFTLTKTTRTQVQDKPVLTMGDLKALKATYGSNLSFRHFERYRCYEKSSSFYQLFFEISDSDHSLSISDQDGDRIVDSMYLYSFQLGTGVDPRYVEIDHFLASEPIPEPEPPVYKDGGVEGVFLYTSLGLYVWDYSTEAPTPQDGVAREVGTVASNDIYTIPSTVGAACRLAEGTQIYRDTVYNRFYTKPGPQGSDLEYAQFVPVMDIPCWWQETTAQAGYYGHTQNVEGRDPLYLYLDGNDSGMYIAGSFETSITVSSETLGIARNYALSYRVDGNVLTTNRGTYLYMGTQKPELPTSDSLSAGKYSIFGEIDSGFTYMSTPYSMSISLDGTGTLNYQDEIYTLKLVDNTLYVDGKLSYYAFDGIQGKGALATQTENGKMILYFYRMELYSDLGNLDTSPEAKGKYNGLFLYTDQGIDISRTLSCVHNGKDIDLSRFFHNGITDNTAPNAQELEYLTGKGFDPQFGIQRIYADQMDAALQKYLGISMAECELVGLRSFEHYNGSYFFNHTANEQITISVLGVIHGDECDIVLYEYTNGCMPQYDGLIMEVMVEYREDGTPFVRYNNVTSYTIP